MISTETAHIKELKQAIRRKYFQILWRINNQRSYIKKNITFDFKDDQEFENFALSSGFQVGYHTHRINNNLSYSATNIEFLSAEQHNIVTGRERRTLSDEQAVEMRVLYSRGNSTRKLAKQFKCCQSTAWQIVTNKSYKDLLPNTN